MIGEVAKPIGQYFVTMGVLWRAAASFVTVIVLLGSCLGQKGSVLGEGTRLALPGAGLLFCRARLRL